MNDDETRFGGKDTPRADTPANRAGNLGVWTFGAGILALFFSIPIALGLFALALILYGVFYVIQP